MDSLSNCQIKFSILLREAEIFYIPFYFSGMRTSVDDLAACYFCMIWYGIGVVSIVLITCRFISIDKGLTKLSEPHEPVVYCWTLMDRNRMASDWYFSFRFKHRKYGVYKNVHYMESIPDDHSL